MNRLNRILAALAVSLLVVTLTLLTWNRGFVSREIERDIASTVASFNPYEILHGVGDDMVRFGLLEQLAARALASPYIRNLVITRLVDGDRELPIIPWKMHAELGEGWRAAVDGWQRIALGGDDPFGYIYLDLDLSALRTMNWAIAAIGLTIAIMLATLLARVWRQETSLTRTVIELNERRREMIRLERLALAGQLAAGLLHDLRKPVLHIKHSLDDLDEALGDFAPAAGSLQDLRRQTRLFFQILTDSQIERFVQSDKAVEEFVALAPIIEFSLNLVRYEQRNVQVIRNEQEGLPPLLAHPFRLIQLFSNLILNAYQAMDGQGRLVIEAARAGRGIEARIIDDGPGIPSDVIERVFDPFFTTKPEGEGTGLGLSISKMIVDDLGGTISVESRAGGPTTFRIWLPAETAAEDPPAPRVPPASAPDTPPHPAPTPAD
ncbi:MAG TPA: ATP-binding protein [Candidatus Sumerlaeota bacterium]|nr:ATP-binding protein [Candidatus Sumerlaeota bacterium]